MGIKSLKNFFALEPPVLPPKVYSEKANMQKDVMYKDASYSICGCLGVLFIYFERVLLYRPGWFQTSYVV
jgi:hypothetical protein